MTNNVMILGARAPVALDHARRFAHHGWKVVVADSVSCRISGVSKAVVAALRIASPRHAPAQFIADIHRAAQQHAIDMIVPTCEEVFYLSRYRQYLPQQIRVLADNFETLRTVHSKWRFLSLAGDCGARIPESAVVRSLGEAREWARGRAVVLKPEFSRFGVHVRLYKNGIPEIAPPLSDMGNWIVQDYAQGTEFCSYSVADRGTLLAHSLYQPRWRMSTSSSFYFAPARIDAIRSFVERFARKLNFTGQLSFDWIQQADGHVTVLECNPRATSGCHLFEFGDPLPAALAGTLTNPIEMSFAKPKMVSAVMLSAGLFDAAKHRQMDRWLHDYRIATDVISAPGDHKPTGGALLDLMSYARLAMLRRSTMREAATQDIEWDGQELFDL